uniref:Cell division protein FtsA n=1 Tax=uncultured bacterium contig00015 TaxID=1181506 RepID=A0A806K2Q3_9BACT|nr:cell division protein FtsA [uncultured bacterium contig00015]
MMNSEIITALDIGSSCVRVIVCERDEDGIFKIIGMGEKPSTGLRKGVVVNIEATLRAVSSAVEDAEMMSGLEVHDCFTGIGGNHINGLNSRGVVGVSGKKRGAREREIGQEDIDRVIEAAKAVVIPTDRQILEVIPQNYKVDDQKGIRNPLDMIGVRLECEVHIITCTITGAQNLIKCVNRAGFRVNELILQTLAAARAVLTQEEMDLGVVLVDLGAGTTDVLVYVDGTPYSTYTIPAGGTQVTSDISIIKNISVDNAEKIKIDAGCCWDELLDEDEVVIVPGVGGRPPMSIPRSQILTIIKPRMEELFKMVKQHLDTLNLPRPLGGGIVLTGGTARMNGVVELANQIVRLPARLGNPIPVHELGGLVEEYRNPSFATVIGLALEGVRRSGMDTEQGGELRQGEKRVRFLLTS